jgi:uncharacterized protein YggE
MNRKRLLSLCSIIVCLALAGVGQAEEKPQPSTIEVVGKAKIMAIPNVAAIAFTVETNAAKAQQAVNNNAKLAERLLKTLRQIGGKEVKLETSGFSLSPVYEKENRLRPQGYRVSNTVMLETKNTDKLGTFIDEASNAGVSRIGAITFSTDQEEQLRKEAAVRAVRQAKELAVELAKAAGLTIKKIIKLSYSPRGPVRPYRITAMTASARTPIEVGEIDLEESVNVVFEAQ